MPEKPQPCPKCGKACELFATHLHYALGSPKRPSSVIAVYECECGTSFTSTRSILPRPNEWGTASKPQ